MTPTRPPSRELAELLIVLALIGLLATAGGALMARLVGSSPLR